MSITGALVTGQECFLNFSPFSPLLLQFSNQTHIRPNKLAFPIVSQTSIVLAQISLRKDTVIVLMDFSSNFD